MGMPEINIKFRSLGVSSIQRSGRGVVALILKDETAENKTYRRLDQVNESEFTGENYRYIQDVFKGVPDKVIVKVVNEPSADLNAAIQGLRSERFDYLAMPEAEKGDSTSLVSFVETSRLQDKKTFKFVAANEKADSELIQNFTTEDIEVEGGYTYTTQQYTARLAGVFAGLDLKRSATYYVLPEVVSVKAIEDPGAAIDNGELILVDDGEKIKIGRAVNSLVTTAGDKGKEYKKIKIVEGMHLVENDIRNTFADNYVGKYSNDYDEKTLFLTAVNAYLKEMERAGVLDRSYDNRVQISVDGQRLYIEGKGISTTDWDTQKIKEYNTDSYVFIDGNIKFVDAMEDLDFDINI